LALRYEVIIRDNAGIEHKSSERFYWYKMAEHFGDEQAKQNVLTASNVQAAEEAIKAIQNFDDQEWSKVSYKNQLH
jgi:predicted NAD-dependent protein-ADP-ribosyltransferase YbiA (DUF1768 family)